MPLAPKQDTQLLEAALIGFQQMRNQIEQKIAELQSQIEGTPVRTPRAPVAGSGANKRTMSPSARRRIAEAQRKRWAEYKAGNDTPAKSAKGEPRKKRVLSAAGRARIIAATKKRWATYRKSHQTGAAGA